VYVKHLSSLQFLSYVGFFAVVLAAIFRFLPGRAPTLTTEPYPDEFLYAHDRKTAKYFVAGGLFLVLGSLHMLVKNLPWVEEYLARTGYAGHLVRDLSNTHLMIVGGGTLLATGLCWYALPRVVGRPLASDGLAQCAFWFTVLGLTVFYVSLVGNGIAIGRLTEHGWSYEAAKLHMGDWYKVPTGIGAGVMGLGYWCLAANALVTIFQSRLVAIPKPDWHLWKFFATGVAALTVGTVQGVIQVQPRNADWLFRAGHAGEWIDPISHAHINLVAGLTMLVAGSLFALAERAGGRRPARRVANACYWSLLASSLAFYGVALYLGFHEGRLVVGRGLTPEQAEEATTLHPVLIMVAGVAMFAAFWFLLATVVRAFLRAPGVTRPFVLAGCAALAVGTLQGPVQAFPRVNELLDRGGEAGDVIVNLHAQLNMLGGLMVLLIGLALVAMRELGGVLDARRARVALVLVAVGMGAYYVAGIGFAAVEAHRVADGGTFAAAVRSLEPWQALATVPAAVAVLAGFSLFARAAVRMTAGRRAEGRAALLRIPAEFSGPIPNRVRRRSPAALAAYELPMGLMGFPGVGWLFAGFPFTATVLLLAGPAVTWAVVPAAFSPYGKGPFVDAGWKLELVWLPLMTLTSSAFLYRAHRRRRRRFEGAPPKRRRRGPSYRTRIRVVLGTMALLLVSLPLLAFVAGLGGSSVRYSYEPRLTREVTGQFLEFPGGPVRLFAWSDPQGTFPGDAIRLHASELRSLLVRAAAVDAPSHYQLFDVARGREVALRVLRRSPTSLSLLPVRPLAAGRYVFVAAHEGMFGGRDYDYLSVVAPGAPVTAVADAGDRTTPAVADALLPLAAALVALLFAAQLVRSALRRVGGQKVLWAAGFLWFALAAACEAISHRGGWTPGLFRTYYLAGGVLAVAYLGAGSAWLLLSRRARDLLLGALLVATVAAAVAVALAPVDPHLLRAAGAARPPSNGALGGHAYLWAIALNTFGTLFLVGGALLAIVRRRRVRVNLWIAAGALAVALATGLSRAGSYSFVYAGQLIGIALMYVGFRFAEAPPQRGAGMVERSAAVAPSEHAAYGAFTQ
jgi:hypothetical protein